MLFERVVSLIVGQSGGDGKELEGLRISFSIEKGATENPNNSTVRIWNLSKATKEKVSVIGNAVILKAGYKQDSGAVTIFTGTVTYATTAREGPDWVTELELRDGFIEFRDNKISLAYGPGTSGLAVLKDVASKFGLAVRTLPDGLSDKQYKDGFSFVGRTRDAMNKICVYLALEWSIQNNEVQIIKAGGVYRKQAIVLSPDTGLIGSPEAEEKTMNDESAAKEGATSEQTGITSQIKTGNAAKGLKTSNPGKTGEGTAQLQVQGYNARSLLQPTMEPGGYVQLKSQDIKGEFFRIETLTHEGDTHGPNWHTEVTLRSL